MRLTRLRRAPQPGSRAAHRRHHRHRAPAPGEALEAQRALADQQLESVDGADAPGPRGARSARSRRGGRRDRPRSRSPPGPVGAERQPGQRGRAVQADRGAVDEQVGAGRRPLSVVTVRRRARRPAARRARGCGSRSGTSARPGVEQRPDGRPGAAARAEHERRCSGRGLRERGDQRRGVGVVGHDLPVVAEDQRVGGSDRGGALGRRRWPAPARPPCGGWSRWRRESRRRAGRDHVSSNSSGGTGSSW